MNVKQHLTALLGLDIGGVKTRATLIGLTEGKYRVVGSHITPSSIGQGLHIGAGVGEAMQALQGQSGYTFLKKKGGMVMPANRAGQGVDKVAMTISAGPRVLTALLGLADGGSIKAGRALIDSLPLRMVAAAGLAELADETSMIKTLINTRPEILILTGGEDAGAEDPILRWIEILRLAYALLPESARPMIIYAGNPVMESAARRRLEPILRLQVAPNLQPVQGEYDLIGVQAHLEGEILSIWRHALPGLGGLNDLAKDLSGITSRFSDRMARFLSQAQQGDALSKTGVLAIDLGGLSTTVSAGFDGRSGTVVQDKFPDLRAITSENTSRLIRDWAGEPVTKEEAAFFLCNHAMLPGWVPETRKDLALSQAYARYCLRQAVGQLSENYDWLGYDPEKGLRGHFEPVIASGAALTHAPTPGGAMLTLLDGLQPWGITTLVLDRHHLLPLLGKIGEAEAVLPVQVLASPAFENLGTVVTCVGDLPLSKTIMTVHVETESGKAYTVDVLQGTLKRLVIPTGETAVLEFTPHQRVDIGFGERGQGGRLRVTGGTVGVVIDARGRPLRLPADEAARIELLQGWQRILGADPV